MKNYRIKEDNKDHFVIHDTNDQSDFKVSKLHIDPSMLSKVSKIQKFDMGGNVDPLLDANVNVNEPQIPDVPQVQGITAPEYLAGTSPEYQGLQEEASSPVSEPQAAPQAQPEGAGTDYFDQYLKQVQGISEQQKAAYDQGAAAAQGAADQQAQVYNLQAQQMQHLENNMQQHIKVLDAQNATLTNSIASTQINPNHFWDSHSTGSKIGMLAGMIVSGFGAGAGQGNMAMNILNKAIDQDIDAQKANLGTKENLLKANMLQYGNLHMAIDATRLNLLAVTKGQIDASQAKLGGAVAQQNAMLAKAQIDQQMAQMGLQLAQQKAGLDYFKSPQGQAVSQGTSQDQGIDPNAMAYSLLLGKMGYPQGIDPKDREGALKEQGEYQKLQGLLDLTKKTFETAAKNTNWREKILKYAPTVREETRRYEGAVNPFLASVKTIMGERASDEVIDRIEKALPIGWDNPATIQQNLDNVNDIIKSQYSFPILKNARLIGPLDTRSKGSTQIKNMAAEKFK